MLKINLIKQQLYLSFWFCVALIIFDSWNCNWKAKLILKWKNLCWIGSLVGEAVPHRGEQLSQPVLVDDSAVIIVEATKCIFDHVLGVGALR